jgi:hypothetical protein
MDRKIERICEEFSLQGEFISCERVTNGHINTTYRVFLFNGETKEYILQKVNTYVFKHPEEMMENISSVTEYIRAKIKATGVSAKRGVLHYRQAKDGKYYTIDGGEFWRCCRYIDDSTTFDQTDNLKVIEESGKAFGDFQRYLADYPVQNLHIAIPHFHNTVMRYETFKNSIREDLSGRAKNARKEIEGYLAFEEIATKMYKMQRRGELPLRVTHNDTKCNNVLFDKRTYEHLSVIDLDTVMPGLVAFDFGDAIRFIANTAAEDEKDLSKVTLDMAKYEAFAKGFIGKVAGSLTENEKNTMSLGALTMTIECGMRFLTDYLDGDKYFKIDYEEHNLVRSRCQLALAQDMMKRLDEMNDVALKYCHTVEK